MLTLYYAPGACSMAAHIVLEESGEKYEPKRMDLAKGAVVAKSLDDLHSDKVNITKDTALTEKGEPVKGRGEKPNEHDILTGSDSAGRYSTAGGDTTCKNWTSSGEGSAIVGHHDRMGLKDSWNSKSWNSSHGTRGCSQENLVSTGGAGYIYCFAPN